MSGETRAGHDNVDGSQAEGMISLADAARETLPLIIKQTR